MEFIWFWTFWHWSQEGFRSGALLRGPLQGLAGHWDEWFCHEASDAERRAIANVGRDERLQRQFVVWLARRWSRHAEWRGEGPSTRFVLGQLAQLPPFAQWPAFAPYRGSYGAAGISAIVIAEGSAGESTDVRSVEAIALPAVPDAPFIATEGFHADSSGLNTAREAALGSLEGRGLWRLMVLWIVGGRRPYPRWLGTALATGWLLTGGLIALLLIGPELGRRLVPVTAALFALWASLVLVATATAGATIARAVQVGKQLRRRLHASQIWIRMNGGLTLRGESAGLAFCLNTLLAVHRRDRGATSRSWLWSRLFRGLRSQADNWAATGVVTADGRIIPVVIEPKLRAGLLRLRIAHILIPRQPGASLKDISRIAGMMKPASDAGVSLPRPVAGTRLGFAAEERRLAAHRVRNVAQSLMAVGDLAIRRQTVLNAYAVIVSAVMLVALPDVRSILWPPPPPVVVGPASASPYHLWVSLDTRRPEAFSVLLESDFWSNRRAEVKEHSGANGSMRAEIRLRRLSRDLVSDAEDGTIWIERRRRFLSREFTSGERVGRYSLSYVSSLGEP